MILNAKNVEDEIDLVETLANEINSEVFHYIPRERMVQISENDGKTVIEKDKNCDMANVYLDLAKKVIG
ncbi:hypothetical protein [Paraclostridium bifermentans]|uniref:hypothetical protein n=1 Tax=Paraclostridium bifermentans TaxID=1490 RepID=UPI002FCD33F8